MLRASSAWIGSSSSVALMARQRVGSPTVSLRRTPSLVVIGGTAPSPRWRVVGKLIGRRGARGMAAVADVLKVRFGGAPDRDFRSLGHEGPR